jgi:hypothetical protein
MVGWFNLQDKRKSQSSRPVKLARRKTGNVRKSFFGIDKGIGPFTHDDEMKDHDSI